ncbi:MAG: HEAT repeat domain-containing protein, partial [Prochloron sp. SP5CPC1]|nr:HEAT repeat domain-containing protein [Candidatus Paraprochloron terpiosi SP5CPC1]
WWRVRVRVARALGKFEVQEAKDALVQLRQDEDYRVVGAALEALV